MLKGCEVLSSGHRIALMNTSIVSQHKIKPIDGPARVGGEVHKALPYFAKELLKVDGCRGRQSQHSSGPWLLVSEPGLSERSYTHTYMDSSNRT